MATLESELQDLFNGGNAEFVAPAPLVLAELNKILTWANTHTNLHSMGPTVPPLTAIGNISATKTQAQ